MTNQLIKEKIKEFRLKAPNSLNHKTISDIEQFLKTSLNEVVESERKRIREQINGQRIINPVALIDNPITEEYNKTIDKLLELPSLKIDKIINKE